MLNTPRKLRSRHLNHQVMPMGALEIHRRELHVLCISWQSRGALIRGAKFSSPIEVATRYGQNRTETLEASPSICMESCISAIFEDHEDSSNGRLGASRPSASGTRPWLEKLSERHGVMNSSVGLTGPHS